LGFLHRESERYFAEEESGGKGARGLEMHRFLLEALRLEDTSVGFCCGKISSSWNFS
jgi:hypothetical protein